MRNKMIALVLAVLTVIAFSQPALADDRFDPWTAAYEKRAEFRLEGIVKGVGIEPTPRGHWTYITVIREDDWFKVYLGPRDFVMQGTILPLLDAKVAVTGAPVDLAARTLLARTLRVRNAVIILRDTNGAPLWEKPGPVEMDPFGDPEYGDAVEVCTTLDGTTSKH